MANSFQLPNCYKCVNFESPSSIENYSGKYLFKVKNEEISVFSVVISLLLTLKWYLNIKYCLSTSVFVSLGYILFAPIANKTKKKSVHVLFKTLSKALGIFY